MAEKIDKRRPLDTRTTGWAKWLAGVLVRKDVSPNQISILSIFPALVAAWILACRAYPLSAFMLIIVAIYAQLRLLCNMLDGMAAIIVTMGFLGGLVMSAIKRSLGAKDRGNMIESHSGMLDRMDSVCFAAPIFFHLTRYYFTP